MSFYLIKLLKKYKFSLLTAIFLMIIESLVTLFIPWFIGEFSQKIINNQSLYGLSYFQISAIGFLIFVIQAFLHYFSVRNVTFIGTKFLTQLHCIIYNHIQQLPLSYFNQRKNGEILSLLTNDVPQVSHFFSGVLISVIPTLFLSLGVLIVMFSIHSIIAFYIAIMLPIFFILLKFLGRKIRPISQALIEKQAQLIAMANENITLIKLIKAFNRDAIEATRFQHQALEVQVIRKKQLHKQAVLSPVIHLLISTGVLIVVMMSAAFYHAGELTIAELISLLLYGLLLAKPVSALANFYGQTQQVIGASKRIKDLLNTLPETFNIPNSIEHEKFVIKAPLIFNEVTFSYENSYEKNDEKPILNLLNFTLKEKESAVIYGANGEGKSTLLNLIMGFIKPTTGKLFINKHNVELISLNVLRSKIALVSQDIALYNGSILENIAYGKPDATLIEIEAAAKQAAADEFIINLPGGYNTNIGENGVFLSGGQRQKIALARAFLIKPAIYLFDEPTSMIDEASKTDFINLLKTLLANETVLIVTHDKALTTVANNIYYLEQGQLIKQ